MIHPGLFARCCSFVPITWPSFVVSELPIIIRRLKNIYHLGKWQSRCYVRRQPYQVFAHLDISNTDGSDCSENVALSLQSIMIGSPCLSFVSFLISALKISKLISWFDKNGSKFFKISSKCQTGCMTRREQLSAALSRSNWELAEIKANILSLRRLRLLSTSSEQLSKEQ